MDKNDMLLSELIADIDSQWNVLQHPKGCACKITAPHVVIIVHDGEDKEWRKMILFGPDE